MGRFGLAARLVWAVAFTSLAFCAMAGIARAAEGYGELGHFGSAGIGHGQFRLTGPTTNGTNGTRAFGVDTTENAIYVGDEPKAKEYRVQKLTVSGAFVAATPSFKLLNRDGIEGIAFDPALKRLYVLALERRSTSLKNDPSAAAAATLYAFSTEAAGEALPPAAGTVEGVLTGPTTFKSQSDVLADALINPKGIAVDPTNHEVIVMGEIDEGGEARSFALQRVDASTGALGARYVDHSGLLTGASEPNSPVVSPGGAVYVEQHEEIEGVGRDVAQLVRIPSEFTSTQPPTTFIRFVSLGIQELEANAVVEFANGSGGESLGGGGGLSLSPEAGGDATIYAEARVFESIAAGEGAFYTGALAFKDLGDTEGFELGWTGGQSRQTTESCAIGVAGPTAPMVAGGAGGTVFILDPRLARVAEFGPGGTGCPTAEAGELSAKVNGTPISEPIAAGTEVKLATSLTRGNALSVEWGFGEGEAKPQLVASDEHQHTEITHTFHKGGELTVTETIHTDNLATPTIVRTTKISVRVNHSPPTAVISGPVAVAVGEAGTFDGSASWDPNGAPGSSPIKSYHWDFGDGSSASSETPEIGHAYAQAGVYAAKLTVVDGFGLESEASAISVTVNVPAPPPKHEEAPVVPSGGLGGPQSLLVPIEPAAPPVAGKTSAGSPSPVPDVRLASTSLTVGTSGALALVVTCPSDESSCAGTVSVRTLGAVSAARVRNSRKSPKAAVLTLVRGAFAVAGGRQESLALRLSPAARKLLARTRTLRARVTILAHDTAGVTHTTQVIVTLRLGAVRGRRK